MLTEDKDDCQLPTAFAPSLCRLIRKPLIKVYKKDIFKKKSIFSYSMKANVVQSGTP